MDQQQYICIDRNSLDVRILTRRSPKNACIRLGKQEASSTSLHLENENTLQGIVYRKVLYPYAYRKSGDDPKKVSYSLVPPDDWLVALAYIAFQGIVQGWAWDITKHYMLRGLNQMQVLGVAPNAKTKRKSKARESRMGFVWSTFTEEGELHELFVGLQKAHKKLPSDKQKEVPSTELQSSMFDDAVEVLFDGKNKKKAKVRLKKALKKARKSD